MSLSQALQHLFPLELGGAHQADLEHDARMLGVAQASAEVLLTEMFADRSFELLLDWEQILGLTPDPEEPLQSRRDSAVRKIRERGGLSRSYFIGLAAAMGYTVAIDEPLPSMAGWLCASDELMGPDVIYQWGVKISGIPSYQFRVGESSVGEHLLWWISQAMIEDLLRALKPAHTAVYFIYEG